MSCLRRYGRFCSHSVALAGQRVACTRVSVSRKSLGRERGVCCDNATVQEGQSVFLSLRRHQCNNILNKLVAFHRFTTIDPLCTGHTQLRLSRFIIDVDLISTKKQILDYFGLGMNSLFYLFFLKLLILKLQ